MIEPVGLGALFVTSFLASTLLPGGSEAALILAATNDVSTPFNLWGIATIGNTLGGMTNWLIGFWLAGTIAPKFMEKPANQSALKRIQHYGSPLLLLSWLPIIGDPLCLVAGWTRIPWISALVFIAIGKGIRYWVLLFLVS